MSSEFTPFVAASMREMLLDMLEKHPEIFDRPFIQRLAAADPKLYEDMKPKEKFEVLWAESGLADRPGAENLWQQMVALGFFEKPASIKHHSNHPGGLCEHSVCVAEAAMELCRTNHAFKKCHRNEVLAAALLHDYCKVGKYRDKGNGEYEYFDAGLVGHGEGSVIMAQQYIKLTAREIVAIRWHMGAYSGSQDWDTLSAVYDRYPEAMCLHFADMIATHYDEVPF